MYYKQTIHTDRLCKEIIENTGYRSCTFDYIYLFFYFVLFYFFSFYTQGNS